jgi:hypothetical protein
MLHDKSSALAKDVFKVKSENPTTLRFQGGRGGHKVCIGEDERRKTSREREEGWRMNGWWRRTSSYKCCKTSFVNRPCHNKKNI